VTGRENRSLITHRRERTGRADVTALITDKDEKRASPHVEDMQALKRVLQEGT